MSRIIAIDCKSYPCHGMGEEFPTMIVLPVLVQRVEGTVKAYTGIVPDTSRLNHTYKEAREWVARNGASIRHEAAARIWPELKIEGYAA